MLNERDKVYGRDIETDFIIKIPSALNHAYCITLIYASYQNMTRTFLEMLCNGFCLSIDILVLKKLCFNPSFNPLWPAPFSYPRVHTKAREFNFARCQRFLIMSKNTLPALRGS